MNINSAEEIHIDENLKNSIKQLFNLINNKIEYYADDKKLEFVKKTSKYGFLIPLEFGANECRMWFNCKDSREVENIFLNFFVKSKKQLNKLKQRFNNSREIKEYTKVYNQAYYNYNKKKYYSSCIVLTSILEGLIRYYAKIPSNEKTKNVRGKINKKLSEKYKDKHTIIFQDKTGISKFIEKFYSSINSCDINNCNYFNRNVLMHGLNFEKFKKIDALKLFNAIDILNNLMIENYGGYYE